MNESLNPSDDAQNDVDSPPNPVLEVHSNQEQKPNDSIGHDATVDSNSAVLEEAPVMAEFVHPGNPYLQTDQTDKKKAILAAQRPATNLASEFQNMSAEGGAVAAFVLGFWSILGSLLTPYSAINAVLALVLSLYGLMSNRKRLATIGLGLALIGLTCSILSMFEFPQWVSDMMQNRENTT